MRKMFTKPFQKPSTGIGRGHGKRNGKKTSPSPIGGTLELNDTTINSVEELRAMAQKGEVPLAMNAFSREGNEQLFEEFNRLYPDPPGILNDYTVRAEGLRGVEVTYRHNLAEAESPRYVSFPSRKSSEAAKSGAIKHAIYVTRSRVELALSCRMEGYATLEMAQKWGHRILSSAEKAQVDREIEANTQRLLKSPMTKRGREMSERQWRREGEGWRRIYDTGPSM